MNLAEAEDATRRLRLDPTGARLASASSRWIWHLPDAAAALFVTRPGTKDRDSLSYELTAAAAARSVGVRTPALLAGPVQFGASFAFAVEWVDAVPFTSDAWPDVTRQLALLADADATGIPPLTWHADWPRPEWRDVLGEGLAAALVDRCVSSNEDLARLLAGDLVLAHGDVQPANALLDRSGSTWLVDFEYARRTPREWDPAKLSILTRRFGDPADAAELLPAWPPLDPNRLAACVAAQETQIVAWLADMALNGTDGAASEARQRAAGLDDPSARWQHLR